MTEPSQPILPARLVRAGAAVVIGVAVLVLVGWAADIPTLKSIGPTFITMKANTAVGLFCLAVASLAGPRRRSLRWLACAVPIGIGVATLAEYLLDVNLGLDEALFVDSAGHSGGFPAGRLAPATALCLIFLATARLLLGARRRTSTNVAQLLVLVTVLTSFQALMGYVFGIGYTFGYAFYTQMAVHTTVLFLVLCVQLLAVSPDRGWVAVFLADTLGGRMARRLLLSAGLVPFGVSWLQALGQRAGFYDANFGVLIQLLGNSFFFAVVVWKNASALHVADAARAASAAELASIVEAIPQLVWTAGAGGVADYFNQRWRDYVGDAGDNAIHPDDRPGATARWAASIAQGTPYECEYRLRRASDGGYRWHLALGVPIRDAHGQVRRWFGSCTDVHDRREAEAARQLVEAERHQAAALQMSEERLRLTFETAFDAVVSINEAGRVIAWNARAEAMFGWSRAEALDAWLAELIIPPEHRAAHAEGIRRFLATRRTTLLSRPVEIDALRRGGGTFPVRLAISPVETNGRLTMTAFIADITETKRVEGELIAARQTAFAAARAKADFLANMSHEIRTPLNGILGMTDLLLETELTAEQASQTRIIHDSSANLLVIVNDILDFSKIEAGKMQLEEVAFDLGRTVEAAVAVLRYRLAEKGLGLAVSIDPALAPAWRGDPGRIKQVLLNLVGNAVKFTAVGGVTVSVRAVASTPPSARLRFTVEDTGIGMAPAVVAGLFLPFTQADSSTARRFGGTGLGLSICKQLVGLMGGEIGVRSEPGRGTCFWFELTCAPASAEDAAQPTAPGAERPPAVRSADVRPPAGSGWRVLVAEDNAVNQLVVTAMLAKLGHNAQLVANGKDAVDAVRTGAFDLVLMDCQMPEMDGYEATRQIRAAEAAAAAGTASPPGRLPIIALTANARKEDEERCLAAGMDGFLSKPLQRERLRAELERWLAPLARSA